MSVFCHAGYLALSAGCLSSDMLDICSECWMFVFSLSSVMLDICSECWMFVFCQSSDMLDICLLSVFCHLCKSMFVFCHTGYLSSVCQLSFDLLDIYHRAVFCLSTVFGLARYLP